MLRQTKSAVIHSLEEVVRLKRRLTVLQKERLDQKKIAVRYHVTCELFIKMVRLVSLADREAVIEPTRVNTEALIACSSTLYTFFCDYIIRLQTQPNWEQLCLHQNFLDFSLSLSKTIFCPDRLTLDQSRKELREAADEKKRLLERDRRVSELIDIHADVAEEDKEVGLEEAILIIQKLERVYQAICRYNYLRQVYQSAFDIRLGTRKLTDEEAIIRIQARTRGYFARKKVKEMRHKELDLLGMSTRAIVDSMRLNVCLSETLPVCDRALVLNYGLYQILSLESLLTELRDNFFPAVLTGKEEARVFQRNAVTENLYFELCLHRLIRENKKQKLQMHELVSSKCSVSTDGRTFSFDIRLFLNCTLLIPLALRGWSHPIPKRWILIIGDEGSGKSAWTEAVASSTGAVNLRLSAAALVRQKRKVVKTVVQYAKADPCTLVIVDKLELFKLGRKTTASQNLLKVLLTQLQETNVFLIGMTRTDQLQSVILDMFQSTVKLQAPKETARTELLARFLVKLDDVGRLPKTPPDLHKLRKETIGMGPGKTGKVVRRHCIRQIGT